MIKVFDQDRVEEDDRIDLATGRTDEKTPHPGIIVQPATQALPSISPSNHSRLHEFDNRTSVNSLSFTVSSRDDAFTASRPGSSQHSNESTSSLDSPPTLGPADSNVSDSLSLDDSLEQGLYWLISKALVPCAGPLNANDTGVPEETFLPADELERIICVANIRRDGECKSLSHVAVSEFVPNRRKIFAILILMGKVTAIKRLVREGIDDNCLPFLREKNNPSLLCHSGSTKVVESLKARLRGWSLIDVETFARYQWQVLVPSFGIDCPCDGYLTSKADRHREFPSNLRMPFVNGNTSEGGYDPNEDPCFPIDSCYQVRPLYIHPAHRNRCRHTSACRETPFAVKLINGVAAVNREVAKREIATLRRFDKEPRPKYARRIIRLLCSFEYRKTFYLIFPYADANLQQFWEKRFPNLSDLPRGPSLARWLAGEMLGLVRGLHLIHHAPTRNNDDKPNGRHGDIKPQNILWFRSERDPELAAHDGTRGMLKICDFGITDFRSDISVSMVNAHTIGRTDAYRPPECDLGQASMTSQKYDSWSLGCVLLYFVTWYAQGWEEGINAFTDRQSAPIRTVNGMPVVAASNFFWIVDRRIEINPVVAQQIEMLRAHPNCNCPLFHNVLDIIENNLLRVNREDRARSDELVKLFKEIYEKCCSPSGNSDYLTPKRDVDRPQTPEEERVVTATATQAATEKLAPLNMGIGNIAESPADRMVEPKKQSWISRVWIFFRALF